MALGKLLGLSEPILPLPMGVGDAVKVTYKTYLRNSYFTWRDLQSRGRKPCELVTTATRICFFCLSKWMSFLGKKPQPIFLLLSSLVFSGHERVICKQQALRFQISNGGDEIKYVL